MNTSLLKSCIAKYNDTQTKLAEYLNLQQSGLSDRINGKTDFRQSEMDAIRKRYSLSAKEMEAIFFAD